MRPTVSFRGIAALALAGLLGAAPAPARGQTPPPDPPRRSAWPGMPLLRHAYLGVSLLDLTPELRGHFGAPKDAGVMVSEVRRDSPAARAGIEVGDVITRVDGDSVESFLDLSRFVADRAKGDKVEVEIVRNRATKKVTVTVDERETGAWLPGKMKTMVIGPQQRKIVIDGDDPMPPGSEEMMDRFFRNPEWQAKLGDLNECDRVRKRLEQVEERLKALEQKLPSR